MNNEAQTFLAAIAAFWETTSYILYNIILNSSFSALEVECKMIQMPYKSHLSI